jgi:hypothetical protein
MGTERITFTRNPPGSLENGNRRRDPKAQQSGLLRRQKLPTNLAPRVPVKVAGESGVQTPTFRHRQIRTHSHHSIWHSSLFLDTGRGTNAHARRPGGHAKKRESRHSPVRHQGLLRPRQARSAQKDNGEPGIPSRILRLGPLLPLRSKGTFIVQQLHLGRDGTAGGNATRLPGLPRPCRLSTRAPS